MSEVLNFWIVSEPGNVFACSLNNALLKRHFVSHCSTPDEILNGDIEYSITSEDKFLVLKPSHCSIEITLENVDVLINLSSRGVFHLEENFVQADQKYISQESNALLLSLLSDVGKFKSGVNTTYGPGMVMISRAEKKYWSRVSGIPINPDDFIDQGSRLVSFVYVFGAILSSDKQELNAALREGVQRFAENLGNQFFEIVFSQSSNGLVFEDMLPVNHFHDMEDEIVDSLIKVVPQR